MTANRKACVNRAEYLHGSGKHMLLSHQAEDTLGEESNLDQADHGNEPCLPVCGQKSHSAKPTIQLLQMEVFSASSQYEVGGVVGGEVPVTQTEKTSTGEDVLGKERYSELPLTVSCGPFYDEGRNGGMDEVEEATQITGIHEAITHVWGLQTQPLTSGKNINPYWILVPKRHMAFVVQTSGTGPAFVPLNNLNSPIPSAVSRSAKSRLAVGGKAEKRR
ncbi:hypothetical protein GE21DRAFT_1258693 [Neurospora crassa]|nr:hypothetical protein B24H17.270 [imported] - Neurospora crassa [Neurospora crassa]KHE83541.1 hypothetical protein GE21DRAFT_1258693 [Neurospora crassa]